MKKVEVKAPINSYSSLHAAIKAGADSVYFGIDSLNMRKKASKAFKIEDLKEISKIIKGSNKKAYLALNSIIYDKDIDLAKKIIDAAKKAEIENIILTDIACMQYAKNIGLKIHISTQQNICNVESLKFFSNYAESVTLARELSLEEIKHITSKIKQDKIISPSKKPVKIEIFAHGALCFAISGKCYISLANYNLSANRGKCIQLCRRRYKVIEEESKKELLLENNRIMSLKDLCTIQFLDKILDANIDILKIEGRARSEEYVYTTVKAYKEAISSIEDKTYAEKKVKKWINELKSVYNRGFWEGGYYLGQKIQNRFTESYGNRSLYTRRYIGKVINYFSKINVAEVVLEAGTIKKNQDILVIGNETGIVKFKMSDFKTHKKIEKKDTITFLIKEKIRKKDKVYVIEKTK